MTLRELTDTRRPEFRRGSVCVMVASTSREDLIACVRSVAASTGPEVPIVILGTRPSPQLREQLAGPAGDEREIWLSPPPEPIRGERGEHPLTAAISRALTLTGAADAVLLSPPCLVSGEWLTRLRAAAGSDTSFASASALADAGTPLGLGDAGSGARAGGDLYEPLQPRLSTMIGPCVYLKRDALELVGELDRSLAPAWSLVDLAQRCLLTGLAHVAADDVVVANLRPAEELEAPPVELRARYPYLYASTGAADEHLGHDDRAASVVLPRALERARAPAERLSVTLDARDLETPLTGTRRHTMELAAAIAATGAVRLRMLVSRDTSPAAIETLRSLANTVVMPLEELDARTARSAVFHRPQQMAHSGDLDLAMRLGERLVLGQLDLIAYRNPGYHSDVAAWQEYRRVNRQALGTADRVVVLSEHTRGELAGDELAARGRTRVVSPGLDHVLSARIAEPAREERARAAPPRVSVEPPFLLCLGSDYLHKNRPFAMAMLTALRERHGWQGKLVLAGAHVPHGSSSAQERECLDRDSRLGADCIDVGPVSEPDREWLMRNATALIYPTVYEGFGLVPLEAGLVGVPCLFAAQTSLAEIAPEAATIVPWNPRESADRAHPLLVDRAARARHLSVLNEAARPLRWAASAAQMLEVYREAAAAPVRESRILTREATRQARALRERIAAHDELVATLAAQREHARQEYEAAWHAYQELKAQTGVGLGLVGPHGLLPEDLQRGLLAAGRRRQFRTLLEASATILGRIRAVRRAVARLRSRSRAGDA